MLLARTRVDLQKFVEDLMAGDPVVWGIVIAVAFFSALGAYKKYRAFSK
jgi:hypothetical protein